MQKLYILFFLKAEIFSFSGKITGIEAAVMVS